MSQHRKPFRFSAARARTAARHRKPSPLVSALQHKPARFAAAMAGSVLVASVGSSTAHWAGTQSRLFTSVQSEAMSTLGADAAAHAAGQAKNLPVTSQNTAALPQSGLAGRVGQPSRPATARQTGAAAAHRVPHARTQAQPQTVAKPAYLNPLRAVSGLIPERVDQGADFGGSGPVYALGDAVITNATGDSAGWPGGGWITYQLTDGPAAGLVVYLAEDVTPTVSVGEHVTSSTEIATMFNGGDGIETGWAQPDGSSAESQLPVAGGISGAGPFPTVVGMNFEALLESLGVPAGNNVSIPASGLLPSNYPTTWP